MIRVELTNEPFVVGQVPPHVLAATEAAKNAVVDVEIGPFGMVISGDEDEVLKSLPDIISAALNNGAKRITAQVTTPQVLPRQSDLHDILDRMLHRIEVELGIPLEDMDRPTKQNVVRILQERGAFGLRGSVEDVADRLGVSRFTVYNYLND